VVKRALSLILCQFALAAAGFAPLAASAVSGPQVLSPGAFAHYVTRFNAMEDENIVNVVPNAAAWGWLQANIPFFECPNPDLEEIYYFRWWSFRKHLVHVPGGDGRPVAAFSEFLNKPPISSALGHHLYEGRWLRQQDDLDGYVRYWLQGPNGAVRSDLHKYSQWLADALWQRYLVVQDRAFLVPLLDVLAADYGQWEKERQLPGGLFWQYDVRDAMEESISGSRTKKNIRPTISSYMFGNARAIAAIARLAGRDDLARAFDAKAAELRRLVQASLWDPAARFFKVRLENDGLSGAREEIGFIPWYFELPDAGDNAAWSQFADPAGFRAPFGLTTAERRSPLFRSHGIGNCEWDGAVWPFATSQTLTALANVLHDYPGAPVTKGDYFDAFLTYVRSQHYDGKPYIGEYLDEEDGYWLKGRAERSRYYNHSTFADLVIAGVVGLRPRADDRLEVQPLLPPGTWDWFCLDGVAYHGRTLTILWDRLGTRYGRGAGLTVLADGRKIAHGDDLGPLAGRLP
jgi:hypothetical protein